MQYLGEIDVVYQTRTYRNIRTGRALNTPKNVRKTYAVASVNELASGK